jgi:23S rRNA pseudouridine1911/1915/1917 synthase
MIQGSNQHSPIEVLYEDNHVIVINKKPSQIVQGDKTGDVTLPDLIKEFLKVKYDKPGNVFCGVVHRLDRPTSGIVLFAKTSKALSRLNEQFRSKVTEKIYWAVSENKFPKSKGKIENYLLKNEKQNKSYVHSTEIKGAKKAILSYNHIASSDKYYLAEIHLDTGRHHQIRAQLANIGCVIKGDVKYGAKRSNPDASIHLHARELAFIHPTTKEKIHIVAPVPEDPLWKWFEQNVTKM